MPSIGWTILKVWFFFPFIFVLSFQYLFVSRTINFVVSMHTILLAITYTNNKAIINTQIHNNLLKKKDNYLHLYSLGMQLPKIPPQLNSLNLQLAIVKIDLQIVSFFFKKNFSNLKSQ